MECIVTNNWKLNAIFKLVFLHWFYATDVVIVEVQKLQFVMETPIYYLRCIVLPAAKLHIPLLEYLSTKALKPLIYLFLRSGSTYFILAKKAL